MISYLLYNWESHGSARVHLLCSANEQLTINWAALSQSEWNNFLSYIVSHIIDGVNFAWTGKEFNEREKKDTNITSALLANLEEYLSTLFSGFHLEIRNSPGSEIAYHLVVLRVKWYINTKLPS